MGQPTHNYDIEALLASDVVTDKQKKALRVLAKEGTMVKTAKVLGIRKRSLQQQLARAHKAYMKTQVDKFIPEGQSLQGTSTLYKIDEDTGEKKEVLQWIKAKTDKDSEYEMVIRVTQDLAKQLTGKTKPVPTPKLTDKKLLVVYVSTDLHLGQYSWHEETGTDVNIDTIYHNTIGAMQLLQATTPQAKECIVLDLGDTLHAANDAARTKSGHELDTDSRHAKVFKTLVEMKITMIDLALEKHEKVKYVIVAGNHSDLVPTYLIAMLQAYYKNEPRFAVDASSSIHKYHRHGQTLLGFTHGHTSKMVRLPEVMVWDRKEDISSTTYRYWLTGHVHSDRVLDGGIARCEAFRNNTHNDAWAAAAGFRGNKQTTAITYHKDFGEIARNICPIKMIKD
jgi:hypothetical protein